MTPCGSVLGRRTRANRNAQGIHSRMTASANRREDELDPGELLKPKPFFVTP